MSRLLVILLVWSGVVLAEVVCPSCKFKNDDSDRYCLECSKELREITPAEKERLQRVAQEVKGKEEIKKKKAKYRKAWVGVKVKVFDYDATGKKVTFDMVIKNKSKSMPLLDLEIKITATTSSGFYGNEIFYPVGRMNSNGDTGMLPPGKTLSSRGSIFHDISRFFKGRVRPSDFDFKVIVLEAE